MSAENPKFVHHFLPGEDAATVLLLHGTGGDENSLIPLGRELAPRAALLSPRGKVLEDGAPRFFRRFAEGVFDHEDLVTRTYELGEFIEAVAKEYGFDPAKLVAVGYSNGANMAASLVLLCPVLLHAAVLFRAMVPFEPEVVPNLAGTSVYIAAGQRDRMIVPGQAERLAEILREAGAEVELRLRDTGHGLTKEEVGEAKEWLSGRIGYD